MPDKCNLREERSMMALRSTLRCVLVKAQQQEELEAACYIVLAVRNKRTLVFSPLSFCYLVEEPSLCPFAT